MYAYGQSVPRSDPEAAKWYREAADHGLALAQLELGMVYFIGQGVLQDYVQAYAWLNLAAAQFSASDKKNWIWR
jgi:uncharacterized protein